MSAANSHALSSTDNGTALGPALSLTTTVLGTEIVAGVVVNCPELRGARLSFR
jgi:hypothetical protein